MDNIEKQDLINSGFLPETTLNFFDSGKITKEVETGNYVNRNYAQFPAFRSMVMDTWARLKP